MFGVINVSKVEVSCGPKKIPLSFCSTDSSWASRYYHVPWGKRMTSAGLKIGLRVIDKGPGLPREKAVGTITYKTLERVITPIDRSPKFNLVGLGDFKTFKEQVTPRG